MKSTKIISPLLSSADDNIAMLRLARSNKDLTSLQDKLKSYACEPKTKQLFEQKNALEKRLSHLKNSNREILDIFKAKQRFLIDPMELIKEQSLAFQELEQSILDYIGKAKKLC